MFLSLEKCCDIAKQARTPKIAARIKKRQKEIGSEKCVVRAAGDTRFDSEFVSIEDLMAVKVSLVVSYFPCTNIQVTNGYVFS